MNIETFVTLLPGARRSGSGWVARCPAHEDRRASFSVAQGQNGRVLVKCHAGCTVDSILDALGLRRSDLFDGDVVRDRLPRKPRQERPEAVKTKRRQFRTAEEAFEDLVKWKGRCSNRWAYQDADGNLVGVVVRWDGPEGKDIRPISKIGDHWEMAAMSHPRPLYRLPDILREPRVLVVEGEKAAEAGWALGFATTTSSNGSQSASQSDWAPLWGKEVIILPDNDAPGMSYARAVTKLLRGAPVVLQLPGLPEGGDLADFAKQPFAAAKLRKLVVGCRYT